MPEDPWEKARRKDAVARARMPVPDDSSDYETLKRIAQKDLNDRVRRVKETNRLWASYKAELEKFAGEPQEQRVSRGSEREVEGAIGVDNMATTEPEQEAQPVKLDVRRAEPEAMVDDIPDFMLTDAWRAKVLANLAAHGMSLEVLMKS